MRRNLVKKEALDEVKKRLDAIAARAAFQNLDDFAIPAKEALKNLEDAQDYLRLDAKGHGD